MECSSLWIGMTIDSMCGKSQFNTSRGISMLYFRLGGKESTPMERLPFQATHAGALYDRIQMLPVAIVLDNVRSLYNVGSFFRTADAARIEKLWLCGITGRPPKRAITKTALGAEESVAWEHSWDPLAVLGAMRENGREV